MFQEIAGPNDNIFYQGHHYIVLDDDKEDMKEFDRNEVNRRTLNDLKVHITSKQCNASEFENLVELDEFNPRILYEITKY